MDKTDMEASTGKPAAGMNIDGELVRELAELLGETGLTEIEVTDGDRRIRVVKSPMAMPLPQAPAMYAMASAPAAAPGPGPSAAPDAAPAPPAPAPSADAIRSPMVGTVYLSPEPEAAPFVTIGQSVKAGDTLLIIEAMKVMNPITAPRAGTVTRFLVDNATPVEFDQPLVVLA